MFGFGLPEITILFAVVLLVKMGSTVVDILKSEFTGNNKIIWVLLVIFAPLLGIIAYHFIGKNQKINSTSFIAQDIKCPFCAETIKAEAKFCRYCSKSLNTSENVGA